MKSPVAVAVLAVAGAALWIGPSSAQAACGDYVHLGGAIKLGKPSHSAGRDAPEHSIQQSRMPLIPLCEGSNCRRQAPAPDLPVPVSPTSGPDHKALLCHAEIAAAERPVIVAKVADVTRSELGGARIERPPRTIS